MTDKRVRFAPPTSRAGQVSIPVQMSVWLVNAAPAVLGLRCVEESSQQRLGNRIAAYTSLDANVHETIVRHPTPIISLSCIVQVQVLM